MSIALYMDHHVNAAVTDGLRRRGVDILTCREDGAEQAKDEEVLARATELGRAVFTQDDDFLALAVIWLRNGRDFAGVVYAHQLGITIGQAIRDLELITKMLDPPELRNRVEFLPYRWDN